MKIFILDTGLFTENSVLENALDQLAAQHEVLRQDTNTDLSDNDWDHIVQEIVSADRVITL